MDNNIWCKHCGFAVEPIHDSIVGGTWTHVNADRPCPKYGSRTYAAVEDA